MADRKKIKEILLSMIRLPNAPDMSVGAEEIITRYHEVLGQWPDELLDAAALHYRSTETFFPTEGVLNGKILDLQMIAAGVPTPAEAWSQVLAGLHMVESRWCDEGAALRDAANGKGGGDYWAGLGKYSKHMDECKICSRGGYQEVYNHPIVAETVRLLGGREKIMTDNPAADRKQFIDAYRERVSLEGRKAIIPPAVKEYIEEERKQALVAGAAIDGVAGRLGSG